jgi:hypothetical protein
MEKLPHKYCSQMLAFNNYRGSIINKPVAAFITDIGLIAEMTGNKTITLTAAAFGLRAPTVKFKANIGPASSAKNVIISVQNGVHGPSSFIYGIHEYLEAFYIN